jgi:hypothetical protein
MTKKIGKSGLSVFEQIKYTDESGHEYWMARQLAKTLDYSDFRIFLGAIAKATQACQQSGQEVSNHLVEFNEVVAVGSGATHTYPSYKLPPDAYYSITQNAEAFELLNYSIFQNHGYSVFCGGLDSKNIHKTNGLKTINQIHFGLRKNHTKLLNQ